VGAASAAGAAGAAEPPLVLEVAKAQGTGGLFLDATGFQLAAEPPSKQAALLAAGGSEAKGLAVVSVHPESGMLYYAELVGTAADAPVELAAIRDVFAGLGCTDFLYLPARWSLRLGARFFEDTPIVPRDEWYPLQQHRVRYFKKAD
jgi:hypothetical protein